MDYLHYIFTFIGGGIGYKILERIFFPRAFKVSEDKDVWALYKDMSDRYHELSRRLDSELEDKRRLRDELQTVRLSNEMLKRELSEIKLRLNGNN